ncbi:MAG TPA: hypothetical protein VNA25_23190 [Phycisphaerae bacterium]|nr:hypothetical protein [Phycisphaerae bacterium]
MARADCDNAVSLARSRDDREVNLVQATAFTAEGLKIEDAGGDLGGGVIRNAAVITAGMAYPLLGEPFEVDGVMLRQVADSINANPVGVKMRLTHPELQDGPMGGYTDGILRLMGRSRNARVEAGRVVADLHIGAYADDSPTGKLGTYVLGLASKDPTAIGVSIRFIRDQYIEREGLPPLGRILGVTATDIVEKPGGNPNGLLTGEHKGNQGQGDGTPGRKSYGEPNMFSERLKKYLISIGLAADASDEQATAFLAGLKDDQKEIAEALAGDPPTAPKKTKPKGKPQPPAEAGDADSLAGDDGGEPIVSAVDRERIGQEALAADGTRRKDIMALAKAKKLPETWAAGLCDRGVSLTHAQELAGLAEAMQPLEIGAGSRFQMGEDRNLATLATGMVDGWLTAADVPLYTFDRFGRAARGADGKPVARKAHERAGQFQALGLVGSARAYLRHVGVGDVDAMGLEQILDLAMNPRMLASHLGSAAFLAMGTSDFPYALGDAMRRTVRAFYADSEAAVSWPLWCGRMTARDYRLHDLLTISELPDLLAMDEGEPIRYAVLRETRERIQVARFGRGMKITHKAIVNDDTGIFSNLPRGWVSSARRKEEVLTTAIITANAELSDEIPLFDEDHANVAVGGDIGAPSVLTLSAGYAAMALQKGLQTPQDGDAGAAVLNIRPVGVLVPVQLEITTQQLIASTVDPAKTNQTPNPFANRLRVVGSGQLGIASAAAWYMFGDPNGPGGGVRLAFLDGEEAPVIKTETEFDSGDLKVACTHNLGAKASDYRGLYENPGESGE